MGKTVWRGCSEEGTRLLSLVDVFAGLGPGEILNLVRDHESVSLGKGEVLYFPDEPAETLFVLKQGRVRIFRRTLAGREFTLSVIDSGTVFGELDLLEPRARGNYAQAMEPSWVVPMHRDDVERLVLERPEAGLQLVNLLFRRLAVYEQRLEDLGLKEVTVRLASVLHLLLESQGIRSGSVYKLPTHYTHKHLATMIGANREAVTRAFARLRESGIVETHRRSILVRDIDLLERVCEDGFYREDGDDGCPGGAG